MVQKCKCDKCEAEVMAIPETPHRRCGGGKGVPIREKHTPKGNLVRGTWR